MKSPINRKSLILVSTATAAALATIAWRRRQSQNVGGMNLQGKVVLITGGSHGLGLALAREYARKGARLVLCARNESELDAAKLDLQKLSAEVLTVPCDVSDRVQVDKLVEATIQHYGRIDVLVNNAGVILVGPVQAMNLSDFQTAMDTMFWGTVYTTMAVLPYLQSRGEGRIVNVTSVGAKVSIPHLLPYSCAKFACAAFSEGMRSELHGTGIKVVTIAPGLMRTGGHVNAIFRGHPREEATWFSVGASLPLLSMSAQTAATRIVSATQSGVANRVLGAPANLLAKFHGMFPGATAEILSLVTQFLPGNRKPHRPHGGRTMQSEWIRALAIRALTALGRRARR